MVKRKFIISSLVFSVFSLLFYVGEFVTGHLHFINICHPPVKIECPNADLSGSDFSGEDLYDANFSGANLSGVDFSGASMNSVDFSGANLSGADLSNAYVISSALQNAVLSQANLEGADLSGSNLSRADFRDAIVNKTIFVNSIFHKTVWTDGSIRTDTMPDTTEQNNSDVKKAVSLSCMDGYSLNYCKVRWSDGSGSLITPYGMRQGGVVDTLIYYDTYWVESCIVLYADGSISASYEMSQCY